MNALTSNIIDNVTQFVTSRKRQFTGVHDNTANAVSNQKAKKELHFDKYPCICGKGIMAFKIIVLCQVNVGT